MTATTLAETTEPSEYTPQNPAYMHPPLAEIALSADPQKIAIFMDALRNHPPTPISEFPYLSYFSRLGETPNLLKEIIDITGQRMIQLAKAGILHHGESKLFNAAFNILYKESTQITPIHEPVSLADASMVPVSSI